MSWPLKIATFEQNKEIGAVWHYPAEDRLYITLPCGAMFPADGHHDPRDGSQGWQVTGELPNISMQPCHPPCTRMDGCITNGVISDDVEGKVFP